MTRKSESLTKLHLTRQQAAAIEQYRAATAGNDFNAYLHAIVALNDTGLYEADATKALAVGYVIQEGYICPDCRRVIELSDSGSGRCECGTHIKLID